LAKRKPTVDKRLTIKDQDLVLFRDKRKNRRNKVSIRLPRHVLAVVVKARCG
jgi:hypothetical protein